MNSYEISKDFKSIEHIRIYKEEIGDYPPDWQIHHIDCNKQNNSIDNLIAIPRDLHYKLHRMMKKFFRHFSRDDILKMLDKYKVEE